MFFLLGQAVDGSQLPNFTNNLSIWQVATTALAVIAIIAIIADRFRTALFKFLTDWQISQAKMVQDVKDAQDKLSDKVDNLSVGQDNLQACIHSMPGHPENPKTQKDIPNVTPLD